MAAKKLTTTQCVKVETLRKETGDKTINLEKWLSDPTNIYVGRYIRIFIGSGDTKRPFHCRASKFGNPFVVGTKEGQYSLEESLRLYQQYLKDSGLLDQLEELRGKNLGCYCDQSGQCHAKILAELLNNSSL